MIDFQTSPDRYRHWRIEVDGPVATLWMDVDENAPLTGDYALKLNSYDLGVDIELYDAIQRLRFEHPSVRAVMLKSAKDRVFCAGANIRMLGLSSHGLKVNFCKFTNETRLSMEDASENSQQTYIAVIDGSCAGGGYELALAADYIILADDGSSSVALPEVPLLAVLPGTGGLTRLTDKRRMRRDRADIFCTLEEGIRGKRAVDWSLVDETVSRSKLHERALERALEAAARSDRPADDSEAVALPPLKRHIGEDKITYGEVLTIALDRGERTATITLHAPQNSPPEDMAGIVAQGADYWPLALARALDDAILHLRFNEDEIGVWTLKTQGAADAVLAYDAQMEANAGHWLMREIILYWKRTLKRLDMSSRSLFALIEPGSCFAGTLAELAFAADRAYMLDGQWEDDDTPAATLTLSPMNFGPYPMGNGLTRLEERFLGDEGAIPRLRQIVGRPLDAREAEEEGLITAAPDDIDWEDEVRIAIEERASFSPDALTGMEASLRFGGPETMETKIFGRLTAWQNWVFQRPNAVGEEGALRLYGTGKKPKYDRRRV